MAFNKEQIDKVEKIRRLSFPAFDKIQITGDGVRIIANLFLNPDCLVDINLEQYIDNEVVLLAELSRHIMTAAPATLALYAKDKDKLLLNRDDVIRCFALDHLDTIKNNQIIPLKGFEYALAHVLSVAVVNKIEDIDGIRTVELQQGKVIYKNVIVPANLNIKVKDNVWHHFGVIIDIVKDKDEEIISQQLLHSHWLEIIEGNGSKEIDFKDENIFHKNVYTNILKEIDNRKGKIYNQMAAGEEIDKAAHNNSQVDKITFTN